FLIYCYILSLYFLCLFMFFIALFFFFFQAEDGIRDRNVTGVQTCALPISSTRCLIPCRSGYFKRCCHTNLRYFRSWFTLKRLSYRTGRSTLKRNTCSRTCLVNKLESGRAFYRSILWFRYDSNRSSINWTKYSSWI